MHSPERLLKKLQGWNAGILPHRIYFDGIFFPPKFCIKKKKVGLKIAWFSSALFGNRLFGSFFLLEQ